MSDVPLDLETSVTDIFITTDGRIRCFGLSRELLALLCETGLADEQLQRQWEEVKDDTNTLQSRSHNVSFSHTRSLIAD